MESSPQREPQPDPAPQVTSLLSQLGSAFDSWQKIAGAVAGSVVFVYLIGGGVMWNRLHASGLPSEEVLTALPQPKLLVVGILQLVTAGLIAAVLLPVGLAARSRLQKPRTRRETIVGLIPLVVLAAVLLTVPVSAWGLFWVVALILLVFALPKLRQWPPWVTVVIVIVVATVLTFTRENEFPTPFPRATVVLKATAEREKTPVIGAATVPLKKHPELQREVPLLISGRYVASTSDNVYVGVKDSETQRLEQLLGERQPESLVVVPRDQVAQLVLKSERAPEPPTDSILSWLGVPVVCLVPACRIDTERVGPPL